MTVTSCLMSVIRKRCENGPWHCRAPRGPVTPPSRNSGLWCSLLKIRPPAWLNKFPAVFWGTIFYISFVLPSTLSVQCNDPSSLWLIARYTVKGQSDCTCACSPPPWHEGKSGVMLLQRGAFAGSAPLAGAGGGGLAWMENLAFGFRTCEFSTGSVWENNVGRNKNPGNPFQQCPALSGFLEGTIVTFPEEGG